MPSARRTVFYRGPRPVLRGYLHLFAFWFFLGTGTSLTVLAFSNTGFSTLAVSTAVYALCLAGMLGVSALYHRVPWKSEGSVQWWRRADHAMIAIFIAGTYGPVFIGADAPGNRTPILVLCWVTALAAVAVNILWINHPRWLSVSIYLCLGWIALLGMKILWAGLTVPELVLIITGGAIYSLGALVYALKWPTISEHWFGFHEVFHAGTIIAAGLHHIAIWMIVLGAG
ncbi:MAG: hemolysin III family protein [Corynebacterium sp.]|jgi:hemolysin III|uniref:PAQR family membrane homeostasis protein TrhA n=1 Tax=unclassified Corynebacterium TaxID=2624378 RepID=UPI000AD7A46D|nr:hemolysin III family protein [Corynebacterium sp. CNJ-954]